jgi:hypothetical protein
MNKEIAFLQEMFDATKKIDDTNKTEILDKLTKGLEGPISTYSVQVSVLVRGLINSIETDSAKPGNKSDTAQPKSSIHLGGRTRRKTRRKTRRRKTRRGDNIKYY